MNEYETALLGAILRGYGNVPKIAGIVTGSDFADPHHEAIWQAIRQVFRSGEAVNPLTVLADMGPRAHRLPGGATYLTDLNCPLEIQAPFYAEKVREAAIRREIADLGLRCRQIEDADDPRDSIRRIREWADRISTRTDEAGDEAAEALERVIDVAENGEPDGVETPWLDLTEMIGGTYPGNLITIAARPGVGKTLMMENWASHMAVNGRAVQFFSLEMTPKELMQRRMAHTAGVELTKLRRGRDALSESDWQRINRATSTIQDHPVGYTSRYRTVDRIADAAWEYARKARAAGQQMGGVFVDYCQLVDSTNRSLSRQQQIGEVTRGLKRLANELECAVFMGSQVNKQSQTRNNPVPQLHDMREADDIANDSDIAILLHEETVEDGNRTLATGDLLVTVGKARNSGKSAVTLRRFGHYARIASAA